MCVGCRTGKDWVVDLLSVHRHSVDTPVNDATDESALLQQIRANFTATTDHYATDVGGLFWVESLDVHVAFFFLNDATDHDHKARSRLPGGPQIHRCDVTSTCFTQTHFDRVSSTAFERDREFWNLCSFLGTMSYGPVYVFPSEQLLCVDSVLSVSDQLRQHLLVSGTRTATSTVGTNKTSASLVFIRRTSSSSVTYSQLLRRVFSFAQDELLTARHGVYIVTDVGLNVGLSTLDGLLKPSSSCIHTSVYSGAKPLFSPISCVIIALHLSST